MKKEIKGENVTNKNLVTIKIKQRKEPITGLYVNHDNNWVAVLENTYDFCEKFNLLPGQPGPVPGRSAPGSKDSPYRPPGWAAC